MTDKNLTDKILKEVSQTRPASKWYFTWVNLINWFTVILIGFFGGIFLAYIFADISEIFELINVYQYNFLAIVFFIVQYLFLTAIFLLVIWFLFRKSGFTFSKYRVLTISGIAISMLLVAILVLTFESRTMTRSLSEIPSNLPSPARPRQEVIIELEKRGFRMVRFIKYEDNKIFVQDKDKLLFYYYYDSFDIKPRPGQPIIIKIDSKNQNIVVEIFLPKDVKNKRLDNISF